MKSNWKRLAALLMAVTMLAGMFAGCGSKESEVPAQNTEADKPKTESMEKEEETKEAEEFSYPMEGRSITHAVGFIGQQEAAGYDGFGESVYAQTVEEKTGVHVEYVQGRDDWFSLMLAEGDYPDVMEAWWNNEYPGGLEGAGRDGVVIPLNDVIDQYMPNFKAWLENNPKDAEVLYTNEGQIYGVPFVYENEEMLNTTGMIIRKDWLDELGLEIPETIDDWHEVLTAFKEEKGVIPYSNTGSYLLRFGFLPAYVPAAFYGLSPETGKVVYGQVTDAYREYLTLMKEWYDEGLIDPDMATLDYATVSTKSKNGDVGAVFGWNSNLEVPDVNFAAVPNPSKGEGEQVFRSPATRVANYWAAISSECEDVEAAARYLDWFYSEEGIMVSNYGVEGVSYVMEDGVPVFTEEITNNPDGLDNSGAQGKYVRAYTAFPGIRAAGFEMSKFQVQATKDSYGIWASAGTTEYVLPQAVKLTAEEAEKVAAIEAEVKTYIQETCLKFIIGTEDINAKWDEYVETCNQFGLDEAIAIYQGAYDRYLAR